MRAQPLVADLSRHLVAITTAFGGADLLVFGALREPRGDVVVTLRGPDRPVRVRRRAPVGPFWVVTEEVRFPRVPAFYAVYAERPLEGSVPPDLRQRLRLGLAALAGELVPDREIAPERLALFRAALLRREVARGVLVEVPGGVRRVGDILMRADVHLPAAVRPGNYEVRTLYFRDGRLAHAQSNVLFVSTVGLEAEIADFARGSPLLYGIASVLLAMGAGFGAHLVFGRR